MSAFIIFLIVVNIGYALYYAAIITIDMNSKGKQVENQADLVDVDGMTDTSPGDEIEEEPSTSIAEEQDGDTFPEVDPLSSNDREPENFNDEDESSESSTTDIPDAFDDNPYGLTDGDEPDETPLQDNEQFQNERNNEVNEIVQVAGEAEDSEYSDDNETTQQENDEKSGSETEKDSSLTFYDPEPSDLVKSLNAQTEPIHIESTMPIQPHMMAMTLLKAHGLIKQDMDKENERQTIEEQIQDKSIENGISNETEVFDKI